MNYLNLVKCDISFITETWLKSTDEDWILCLEYMMNGWKLLKWNREEKTGGGTCCLFRPGLRCTIVDSEQQRSFEHLIKEVGVNGQKYNFVIVY